MKSRATNRRFDVCILALADLRTDARTMNIATALSQGGKSVCVLCPDWMDTAGFEHLHVVTVPVRRRGRLWRKWLDFTRAVDRLCQDVEASSYWAEDLWTLTAATRLARKHHATVLYDSREIYSALGPLHERPLTQFFVAALERIYARRADTIIVSGELDAEYIRQHLHRNEKPDVVMNVPPYTDPHFNQNLRERFDIGMNNPVVVYQGVVLEGRGIEQMLYTLPLLPDYHFCVIGDGPLLEHYRSLSQQASLDNRVHFLGTIPNHELLAWTASADIGLCFVEPISFSYSLALPNKLFEYAMARIPALVTDLPAMHRVIEKFPFGELVSANAAPSVIAQLLEQLYRDKVQYTLHADAAARFYNREAQEAEINRIAEQLIGARTATGKASQ